MAQFSGDRDRDETILVQFSARNLEGINQETDPRYVVMGIIAQMALARSCADVYVEAGNYSDAEDLLGMGQAQVEAAVSRKLGLEQHTDAETEALYADAASLADSFLANYQPPQINQGEGA
jgi:hypothetical protein